MSITVESIKPYPSVQEVGILAADNAAALLSEEFLNLDAVEMHMRGFAGLYAHFGRSGNRLTHDQPSVDAQVASVRVANASYEYFTAVGQQSRILRDVNASMPRRIDGGERDAFLVSAMQRHVLLAAMTEQYRAWRVIRRGFRPAASVWQALDMPLEDPKMAEAERLHLRPHYSELGIRAVLAVFGHNLGPFIEGIAEAAPDHVDPRSIVGHAVSSISSARPHSAYAD